MYVTSDLLYFCCRYLLEQKANVAAVNNDGDLAIDICEDKEMRKILQEEMDNQGTYPRIPGSSSYVSQHYRVKIYIYGAHSSSPGLNLTIRLYIPGCTVTVSAVHSWDPCRFYRI